MCGRFTLTKEEDYIEYRFSRKSAATIHPSYNVAPGSNIAIISQFSSKIISASKWGWSNLLVSTSGIIINARCETVMDKNLYSKSLYNNRCLIIADGYIEWQSTSYGKQPYLIKFENDEIFTFAGLLRQVDKTEDKTECLILTTEANRSVSHIHKRMPLILSPKYENLWIDDQLKKEDFKNIFSSNLEHALISYPIDKKINIVSNNFSELLNSVQVNQSLFD